MIRPAASPLACALLTGGLALTAGGAPFVMPPGWDAYLRDPAKGTDRNLVLPLEANEDRLWLGLRWTDFRGPRLRIAIMPVDDKAAILPNQPGSGAAAAAAAIGAPLQQVPVNAVEDLLGSAFHATHRFRLFDRKALEGILAEKQLQTSIAVAQASALPSPGTPVSANPLEAQRQMVEMAAKGPLLEAANKRLQQLALGAATAKLVGAQFIVYASITEWTPDRKAKRLGMAGLAPGILGSVAGKGTTAEVAMSFRVVDAATGEVKDQIDERATAENWGFSIFGFGIGNAGAIAGAGGLEDRTPINYAVRACINKAVYRITKALKEQPWRGAVVKVTDTGTVYVNGGKEIGLEVGMVLDGIALGELLKDPTTGEVLDAETKRAGTITLTEVRDRLALGTLDPQGSQVPLHPGDRVELALSSKKP